MATLALYLAGFLAGALVTIAAPALLILPLQWILFVGGAIALGVLGWYGWWVYRWHYAPRTLFLGLCTIAGLLLGLTL
jgi:hypothetical protein